MDKDEIRERGEREEAIFEVFANAPLEGVDLRDDPFMCSLAKRFIDGEITIEEAIEILLKSFKEDP
jgi:hypothetical protein